jgi:hypothetical protein
MWEVFMKRFLGPLAALVIATLPLPANADAVSVNQLYGFGFGGVGSALVSSSGFILPTNPTGIDSPAAPWTFTLATAGTLTVQDLFISVDQFEIFDFGSSIGTTSPPTEGSDCGSNFACSVADLAFSRGIFYLAAGDHSISGIATISGAGSGAGAFIVSTVPLPAALPLFATGLGAMGLLGWRRKKKAQAAA